MPKFNTMIGGLSWLKSTSYLSNITKLTMRLSRKAGTIPEHTLATIHEVKGGSGISLTVSDWILASFGRLLQSGSKLRWGQLGD
jgi:hypothetical protein